ncbi:MAG TPA: hypothetical protein VIJ85_06390 [Rhizomicrobium sp.]
MNIRRVLLACALALPFLATAADAAQFVVVEARGIAMKVGAIVDPTKPLVLTQGQHLTLVSDTGQTIKLDGPYSKAPAAAQGVQLAAAFGALVTSQGGRAGEIGTTRGAGRVTLPSAWVLDATHSGTVCLQQGQQPVLWRPAAGANSVDITIMPADRSWKAQAAWPKGAERLAVKSDVGMHGDASYFVVLNGNEAAMTVSTIPAALTTDQMRAAWMLQKGCTPQAEALMRSASK